MAALTGLFKSSREGPIGPSPSGATRLREGPPAAKAFRSAPEQNVSPSPQRTPTLADGSLSKARKASASACAVSRSTALRTCGRSSTTVVIGPALSMRTLMRGRLPPLLRVGDGRREPGARRRQIAVLQRCARCRHVVARLRREGGLRLRELRLHGGVAGREHRQRLPQRRHAGFHLCPPSLLIFLGGGLARLAFGDLSAQLLDLARYFVDPLRLPLQLRAFLLEPQDAGAEILHLAAELVRAAVDARDFTAVGRAERAQLAGRIGAQKHRPSRAGRPCVRASALRSPLWTL